MPDTLPAGSELAVGQELQSNNGRYRAVMQGDGNFVLYEAANVAVWSTDTWRPVGQLFQPVKAVMQGDGNFVLYSAVGFPAWASGTDGRGGDRLVLQNDRNLAIYTPAGEPVWESHTAIAQAPPPPPPPPPPAGVAYPMPVQVPVHANPGRLEVGWGKFMTTDATLYRDGRLVCDVRTENSNWTGGLRGRLLVVGVDLRGNACWVSQEMWATTRCSVPDFSCASTGRETLSEAWPAEAARIVDHLDIYMGDAASFVDLRKAVTEAIKTAGELAQYLGPLLALL